MLHRVVLSGVYDFVPFVKLVGLVIPMVAINLPAMCVMVSLSYSPCLTLKKRQAC